MTTTLRIKPSSEEQGEFVIIDALDFDPSKHERMPDEDTVIPGKYDELNRSALEELALRRFKASMAQFSDEDLREAFEHDDHVTAERAAEDARLEAIEQAKRDGAAKEHEDAEAAKAAEAAQAAGVTAEVVHEAERSALYDMKLAELLAYAAANTIDLGAAKKKADILAAIEDAEAAKAAEAGDMSTEAETEADPLDAISDDKLVELAVQLGEPLTGVFGRPALLVAVKSKRDELGESGAKAVADFLASVAE